jgi:ATP sulfurylase
VGRDHTGVGNYYEPDAALKFFDQLNLDIKILSFNSVSYNKEKGMINVSSQDSADQKIEKISGSIIRDKIMSDGEIPDYLMRPSIVKILKDWKTNDPQTLFQP